MSDYWIKPVFVVLGIVVIVMFCMFVPSNWFGLDWSNIRDNLIYFLPLLIALGVGFAVLSVLRR